jgi:threonine dehydrogenase-like Zn-dependent dehydrogenase
MTDGRGADVCIDAVGCEASGSTLQRVTGVGLKLQAGAATAIAWAIGSVRKAGHVSIVGVYGPPWNLVPIGTAMNKGLTLRMNQCNVKRYMPHLLEHVRSGRVNPKEIITHRLPLEEVAEGYHLFSKRLDGCIKTVLIPPSAAV